MATLEECEAAKAAGNAAVSSKDYTSADGHYTSALDLLASCSGSHALLRATLLCNRATARHQLGILGDAAQDASCVLELLPEGTDPKLRVKALYRRALCREGLGELAPAFEDLNLALKLAPTNEGVLTAAKRLKAVQPVAAPAQQPASLSPAYTPPNPFFTADVMRLADADCFPGRLKGYSGDTEDPVVRFANGMGVQCRYETGGTLLTIRSFGGPRIAPWEVFNMARDFHTRPNFPTADGLCTNYSREGHLREVISMKDGQLDGPYLLLNPNGTLDISRSQRYKAGRVESGYISNDADKPGGQIAHALVDMVVPMKKALQIALAPGEERLLQSLHINVECVREAALSSSGKASEEHKKWMEDRAKDPLKEKHMVVGDYVMNYPPPPTTWSLPEEKKVVKMR